MRAGKLDRQIVIQRKSVTYATDGSPINSWSTLATVWAQQRPNRGDERFAVRGLVGKAVITFQMRYRADLALTNQDRIVYDGKTWDIADVREIGRHVVTEIDATAQVANA